MGRHWEARGSMGRLRKLSVRESVPESVKFSFIELLMQLKTKSA